MKHIVATQAEVDAIPGPKHVWFDIDHFVVLTGNDMPVQPTERIIAAWKFRDRFTAAEMDAVLALAYAGDANARRLVLKLQTASDGVDLDSSDVQQGMAYLVSKSAITQTRSDEILA
jgi:hypothetical protein